MVHHLEWVRLDYILEDTGVFLVSFQAHHNCRVKQLRRPE